MSAGSDLRTVAALLKFVSSSSVMTPSLSAKAAYRRSDQEARVGGYPTGSHPALGQPPDNGNLLPREQVARSGRK